MNKKYKILYVPEQETMTRVKASITELENIEETQTEDISSLVCILSMLLT